jgi:hypothetical protein
MSKVIKSIFAVITSLFIGKASASEGKLQQRVENIRKQIAENNISKNDKSEKSNNLKDYLLKNHNLNENDDRDITKSWTNYWKNKAWKTWTNWSNQSWGNWSNYSWNNFK